MKVRNIAMGITAVALGAITLHHDTAHANVPLTHASAQAVDGKEVYLKSCKECHGVIGAPPKAMVRKFEKIPNFTDSAFFKTRKDAELLEAVEKGKGRDMKGYADKLSKEELKAVVTYIHTLAKQ